MYHVYILRCSDGSLYVGYTRNVEKRLQKHNQGLGAKYTSKRRPTVLVYSESHDSELGALRRERQLKRWTRNKKEALIRGDLDLLRSLSKKKN
jgi:putative endonuclease